MRSRLAPIDVFLLFMLSLITTPADFLCAQSLIGFSARTSRVSEEDGEARITVNRLGALDTVVTVDYFCQPFTAVSPEDYIEVAGTLRFGANETNQSIAVLIVNDGALETQERFQVMLTNVSEGAVLTSLRAMTVFLDDNETPVEMEFANYSARESSGHVLVAMTRHGEGGPLSLNYLTTDGTASEGSDYAPAAGTILFDQGENLKLVTIPVLDDGIKEPSETFSVRITDASAWPVGPRDTATVTVMDDDPGVQFEYEREWVHETDGAVVVQVLRGNDISLGPFTVDYETVDGTAESGAHFVANSGQLQFNAGDLIRSISIPILNDPEDSSERSFQVRLTGITANLEMGAIQTNQITILDMTDYRPYRFTEVGAADAQQMRFTLDGSVPARLRQCFELCPIEASSDMIHWEPWITLTRTNSTPLSLTVPNDGEGSGGARFYRTPTWPLGTPIPPPTGPYAVGLTTRFLGDPTRRNRYFVSTNNAIPIAVWYPATPVAGRWPRSHLDQFDGAYRRSSRFRAETAFDAHRARDYVSHAISGAPVAEPGGPYPVVLFSHGWRGATLSEILVKAEELASHGYVVVAVLHYDSHHAFLPDGTSVMTTDAMTDWSDAGFRDRVRDLEVVLEHLEEWNGHDALFQNQVDLTRTAAMGFSWGGGVAAELGRVDSRVKAVVLFDAYLQNASDLVEDGLFKPFMGFYSTEVGGDRRLFDLAAENALWCQIDDSAHGHFQDTFWLAPDPVENSRHLEVVQTVAKYALWFLNRQLRDDPNPMPPLSDNPRVIGFLEK